MNIRDLFLDMGAENLSDGAGLLFFVLCVAGACIGQLLVWRFIDRDALQRCQNAASAYFSVVATLYALLLGLIVFDSQARFEQAKSNVEAEASAGLMTFALARSLPGPMSVPIREHFVHYVNRVLDYEWDEMQRGHLDQGSRQALIAFSEALTKYDPVTPKEQILLDKMYDNLTVIWEMRRERLDDVMLAPSTLLWSSILIGGAATIFLGLFFVVDNNRLQLLMTAILTLIITVNIYIVSQYANPYSGEVKIHNTSFAYLREYVMQDR